MLRLFVFLILFIIVTVSRARDENLAPISADNAAQLTQIGLLGRGAAHALDWHPHGGDLAVGSARGVWLLDQQLNIIHHALPTENVTDLRWNADGTRLALISNFAQVCSVQVWDAQFVEQFVNLPFCGYRVLWNPDGTRLAILPQNTAEIALIDVHSGEQIATFIGQGGVWSLSGAFFFSNARTSLNYTDTPALYIYEGESGQQLARLEYPDKNALGYGGFPELLWALSDDTIVAYCVDYNEAADTNIRSLCKLDVYTGTITLLSNFRETPVGRGDAVQSLQITNSEMLIGYIGVNPTPGFLDLMFIFEPRTGQHTNIGYGEIFDWRPNTHEVAVIVGNGFIRVIDVLSGDVRAEHMLFTAPLTSVAWHPNNQEIASSPFGYEQYIRIWSIAGSDLEPRLSFSAIEPAETVAYIDNGSTLIRAGTIFTDIVINHSIMAHDSATGELIQTIDGFYDQFAPMPLHAWNADYTLVAIADDQGIVNLPNGVTIQTENILTHIFWSPDNTILATVSRYPDDYAFSITTWNIATGEKINVIQGGMFSFDGLFWSPDSQKIAVSMTHPTASAYLVRVVRIFNVQNGDDYIFDNNRYEIALDDPSGTSQQAFVAWNSDSTLIAITLSDVLQVHSLTSRSLLVQVDAHQLTSIDWSDDDRMIAVGSADGTIRLWGVPVQTG